MKRAFERTCGRGMAHEHLPFVGPQCGCNDVPGYIAEKDAPDVYGYVRVSFCFIHTFY